MKPLPPQVGKTVAKAGRASTGMYHSRNMVAGVGDRQMGDRFVKLVHAAFKDGTLPI